MDPSEIVELYFTLAVSDDVEAVVGQFADDAVVVDDGHERRGHADLRAWRRAVPSVSYTVRDVRPRAHGATADVVVAGDFPGSPVPLRFAFGFDDAGRITTLDIRPRVAVE